MAKAGLVVVEEEAEIVRQIFALYGREGLSIRGIAERLSTDGIPSPTGRPTWGKSSIFNILRNETYVGKNHYNKHKRNGMKLAKRPRDEWIPIETTLIVDTLLFAEVQEKLRRNKDVRRQQPRRFYMLGGMVFCPDCGRVYTSQTQPAGKHRRKNDAPSYRHRAKEGHCRNRMISARKVDPIVWDRIVEVLLKPDNLREGYEESFELQQATTKRYGRSLQTLKRSRVKLDQKRKNLMDVYLDPDIQMTKPEFLHQQAAIDNELGTLEREIKSIEEDLAEVEIPPEYETIEAFADEIRDQLEGEDELTPREKRKILELLNIRVYIPEDGNLWLEGWFQSSSER